MKRFILLLPPIFAILFVWLLRGQPAGVNVLILDALILFLLYVSGRINTANTLMLTVTSGLIISGFMVLLYGSSMAVFANVVSMFFLIGIAANNTNRQLINAVPGAIFAIISGPYAYLNRLFTVSRPGGKNYFARFMLLIIFPLVVALVFAVLYAGASPFFNNIAGDIIHRLQGWLEQLFNVINPVYFWLFVAGVLLATAFAYGLAKDSLKLMSGTPDMHLKRQRRTPAGRSILFRLEYRSGVIVLLLLNVLLGLMNILDIWNVWLFFDWNGGYLKQFVHGGTWLLICSIVISILIVLYYFRGNLNFYSRRKLLLRLALVWLAQNAILVASVALRNWLYIQHFNLAFKRIWVYAFLLLTLFGIYTVMIKIIRRKTSGYLFYYNSIAAYLMVIALSLVNWDQTIARYNYKHYRTAFFHTNFMVTLDASALPVLKASTMHTGEISSAQEGKFDFPVRYMTLNRYSELVNRRCRLYIIGYPMLDWQGWNVSAYLTYRALLREANINQEHSSTQGKDHTSVARSKQK
ncbi:MAG: DUF4173 domain-containing protein [Lentimicrobiaceae bacterium]|nr:DUF4173 domain-containing protein [Lentimicrobiaceae bacterium]